MAKIKRLIDDADSVIEVINPVSNEELQDRIHHYSLLNPQKFSIYASFVFAGEFLMELSKI